MRHTFRWGQRGASRNPGIATNVATASESTTQTRDYDGFGNVIAFTDGGEADTLADNITYAVHYTSPGTGYIIRPDKVTATDNSTTILRQRDSTYGTHGELLTLTTFLKGGKKPDTGAAYDGTGSPTWTFEYDALGNVKTVHDPKDYILDYLYDDTAKTYRKRITDRTFGYVSESVPNLLFGTVDTTTDLNGNLEHFDYDEFGRLSKVFGPKDIGTPVPTIRSRTALRRRRPATRTSSPRSRATRMCSTLATTIDTAVFIDGLKRVLQTKKDLERDPGTGVAASGVAISGVVHFDSRGRVSDQSQPSFAAGGSIAAYTSNLSPLNPTFFTYDILSRVRDVATPDFGITSTEYDFSTLDGVLRRTKTITDPNGKVRLFYQSVRDEILAVKEQNTIGGSLKPLVTRYKYDPLSELTLVTDAKSNPTTAVYDTLGQMVSLDNKDTRRVDYRFDLSGNLGAKETPNLRAASQLIRRIYDHTVEVNVQPSPSFLNEGTHPRRHGCRHEPAVAGHPVGRPNSSSGAAIHLQSVGQPALADSASRHDSRIGTRDSKRASRGVVSSVKTPIRGYSEFTGKSTSSKVRSVRRRPG